MGDYVVVHAPGHPRAGTKGFVLEHILVAEKALGHHLPKSAQVHHVDENGQNNAPSNLVICQDQQYHKLLHRRMKALAATGNADAMQCNVCGAWDEPKNLRVFEHRWKARPNPTVRAYHPACKTAESRRNSLRPRFTAPN